MTKTVRDGEPTKRFEGAFERELGTIPSGAEIKAFAGPLEAAIHLGTPEPFLGPAVGYTGTSIEWQWGDWRIGGEINFSGRNPTLELAAVHKDGRPPETHRIDLLDLTAAKQIHEAVTYEQTPVPATASRTVATINLPISVTALAAIADQFATEYGDELTLSYSDDGTNLLINLPDTTNDGDKK